MRSYDVRIDVTGRVDLGGALEVAATVHLPDRINRPLSVLVGYPGGAYGRRYYDIDQLPDYSQAKHHTDNGFAFVACDHFGIGDGTQVDPFELTVERMSKGNHAAISVLLDQLRAGTLIEGVSPLQVEKVLGMGQSMGGAMLTLQQGTHGSFDAIAVLGYSCIEPSFAMPDGSRVIFPAPPRGADLRVGAEEATAAVAQRADMLLYTFHTADTEPELVKADLAGPEAAPWRLASAPPCAATTMGAGAVAQEAAAIDVPVLVACGEIDVVADARLEPAGFRSASDIAVFIVPRMAHMHNFARTRSLLWDRIERFAREALAA